jgi:beta-galactosidase/beta-glucuronidase
MTAKHYEEGDLHPNPQMTRRDWIDLTGTWDFAYDDQDQGFGENWQNKPERFSRQISVPFPPESELSGIGDTNYHPVVWYRRSFARDTLTAQRAILCFGAVDYSAHVWVNGQLVCEHQGGHSSFSVDITHALTDSGEQTIVVRAEDQPGDLTQPRGKQEWQQKTHAIWYNRTTGIWQPVWIEQVPDLFITDLRLIPDIANSTVQVEAVLNRLPAAGTVLKLRARFGDELLAEQSVTAASRMVSTVLVLNAARPGEDRYRLVWRPEAPNLIDLDVTLETAESADKIQSYFGLRSCGFGSGRFLLNGRPYFLRLVLEQGYWPESHLAAPSQGAIRKEVELIKALGFNGLRIHQKVEDPRFLYWCDKIGLLVWGEMANAYEFTPEAVDRFTREWLSVVARDRNHPCIVTWVPLNESWGVHDVAVREDQQHYISALYHLTKALDPTRPALSNEGWEHTISDIWGVHDYSDIPGIIKQRYDTSEALEETLTGGGPQRRKVLLDPNDQRGQPVVITEFGGISFRPAQGEAWFGYATVKTEDEYVDKLRGLFDAMHDSPNIAGYCYTQLTDTMQEANGLLTEDREPKFPIERLRPIILKPSRAIATEFLDLQRQIAIEAAGKENAE